MHTQPMKESEGKFADWKTTDRKCPKCKGSMLYREWDSSCGGYTDYKYRCETQCGYTFWVDGVDS